MLGRQNDTPQAQHFRVSQNHAKEYFRGHSCHPSIDEIFINGNGCRILKGQDTCSNIFELFLAQFPLNFPQIAFIAYISVMF